MVYQQIIRQSGKKYLRRWVLRLPWGWSLRWHVFEGPDAYVPHDHPFWFASIGLWGAASEELFAVKPNQPPVLRKSRLMLPLLPRFYRSTHVHRIDKLLTKKMYTLVLTGRRIRGWGFWAQHGWVAHRDFTLPGDGAVNV